MSLRQRQLCHPQRRRGPAADVTDLIRHESRWDRRGVRFPRRPPGGEDDAVDDPPALRLAPIDQHNWRAAVAVQVSPEQVQLVAGHQPVALVILAKAYVRPGDLDWEPLAVTAASSVVGVVALAHARTHTELLHLAIRSLAARARAWIGRGGPPGCPCRRDSTELARSSAYRSPRQRACAAPVPEPGLLAERTSARRRADVGSRPRSHVVAGPRPTGRCVRLRPNRSVAPASL